MNLKLIIKHNTMNNTIAKYYDNNIQVMCNYVIKHWPSNEVFFVILMNFKH